VLNPYPEPQLKGYVSSHNSRYTFRATIQRTPASRPLRYHRSLVDHAQQSKRNTHLLQHHSMTQITRCQAHHTSRPLGGGHVSPGTTRLWYHSAYRFRLAEHCLPPSASRSNSPLFGKFRLAGLILPPGTTPVLAQYWFCFNFRYCISLPYSHIHLTCLINISYISNNVHYLTTIIITTSIISQTKFISLKSLATHKLRLIPCIIIVMYTNLTINS